MTPDNLVVLPHGQHDFDIVLIEGQFVSLELTYVARSSNSRCLGGHLVTGDARMAISSVQALNLAERARAAIDGALIGSGFVSDWTLQ